MSERARKEERERKVSEGKRESKSDTCHSCGWRDTFVYKITAVTSRGCVENAGRAGCTRMSWRDRAFCG